MVPLLRPEHIDTRIEKYTVAQGKLFTRRRYGLRHGLVPSRKLMLKEKQRLVQEGIEALEYYMNSRQ